MSGGDNPKSNNYLKRGPGRTRTAVKGFADLCLAARPRDLVRGVSQKERKNKTKRFKIKNIKVFSVDKTGIANFLLKENTREAAITYNLKSQACFPGLAPL